MPNNRAPLMSHEDRVALITRPFGITTRVPPHSWAGCFIPEEAPTEEPQYPTRYRAPLFLDSTYGPMIYDHPDHIYIDDEETML